MLNLGPLVDRVFGSLSLAATVATWLLLAALVLAGLYLITRTNPLRHDLLDFGLVSTLTLLVIDHRQYDQFLLFPGILFLYVYAQKHAHGKLRWSLLACTTMIVIAICSPNDASVRIAQRFQAVDGNYARRVIAPYQTWASLALLGVLVWLKTRDPADESRSLTEIVQRNRE